ncbi:subtilisin-like serine protease [Apiospora arundinis]
MDADADAMGGGGASPPGVRRACDQCRLRKIRCDKETPCSNCRSAKRSCSSTGLGQKPKEPRQRVLISSQYEKKIDFMGDRLATIEALLRDLSTSPRPANNNSLTSSLTTTPSDRDRRTRQQSSETSSTTTPGGASDNLSPSKAPYDDTSTVFEPDDSETFEGSTSLAAHAAFASDFVASASIAVAPFSGSNPRMEAALSSLKQMVELQNSRTGPGSTTSYFDGTTTAGSGSNSSSHTKHRSGKGYVRLKDLPMPPMELVISELRELQSAPGSMMLLVVTCFTDQEVFVERCRRLYFHTDRSDIPESLFINVNAGLIYLFFEKSIRAPAGTAEKAMLEKCTAMCQFNMETAIAQLPLLMPATLENCEALLMGASFAIDVSRPSLAWLLTERAANMCRTLGLHQEHTLRGDTPELRRNKALIFWSAYMLDKGLSLRLGRASVLQDYDIGVPAVLERTALDDDYGGVAGSGHSAAILSLWVKHAEVQGRIYQRLYSPGALRQAESSRAAQVQLIIVDLQFLLRETQKLLDEAAARARGGDRDSQMFALILKSDEVGYWSSAALAYRALPPSTNGGGGGGGDSGSRGGNGNAKNRTFADECTDAARAAMRSHQECMDMMSDTSLKVIYLHWTILYAPFIPFIVIFCQVIENSGSETSQSDLRHLERFIQSLEAGCGISPAVEKLHRLSSVLYNVALLYAEAKAQQAWDQDMVPVGNEFDLYLSQLGIMPMDESGGAGDPNGGGAAGDMGNGGAGGGPGGNDVMRNVQLGDWFSGNNHILGLVEEDLSGFNTSMW